MPYIEREERARYEKLIQESIDLFSHLPTDKIDGHLNYFITRLLAGLYIPSYFNYNRVQGLLECIKQEFYRRRVAPYENEKMRLHGDVFRET